MALGIGVAVALLVLNLLLFWEIEKRVVYSPTHYPRRSLFEQSPENYFMQHIEVQEGIFLEGVIYEPEEGTDKTLFYFGGKEQDSVSLVSKLSLTYSDVRIIAFNYRAYGNSDGKPSQVNIFKDMLYLYDMMHERYGDIYLMGYSLGSSVASHVASKRHSAKALILISAFDSVVAFAKRTFPFLPALLFKNPFRSDIYVRHVVAPTYLYVSVDDGFVDIDQARNLHTQINNLVEYKEFSGYNHSSLLMSDEVVEKVQGILRG